MPVHDDLGLRMKEFYEKPAQTKLTRRMPVAIRLDGKAFHTFTRGFKRPYDDILMTVMQETMRYLCKNIQGCVFGYTQSDEITLILVDYQKLTSAAWFDYEVQKICSISASMATMYFNNCFKVGLDDIVLYDENLTLDQYNIYVNALEKGAMFDARCFNIPKEEVCNLIYWRQLDATRNSIQMAGQAYFSHAELQNKTCNNIQEMLFAEKGINWNDYPIMFKRGSACIRNNDAWIVDKRMPVLKGEDRIYVERFIFIGEE